MTDAAILNLSGPGNTENRFYKNPLVQLETKPQ
jgi:hypothetical protein